MEPGREGLNLLQVSNLLTDEGMEVGAYRASSLEQLRDTPVVLFPQEVAPGLYDRVHGCCERAGIDVQHALQSSQLSSSLSMVSAGGGFALVPKSMAAISPPNVTYHALSSPELYTDIALCWRRFECSRTVKRFLAMMSEG